MKTAFYLLIACIAVLAVAGDFSPFALRAVAGFTIATLFFLALLSLHK